MYSPDMSMEALKNAFEGVRDAKEASMGRVGVTLSLLILKQPCIEGFRILICILGQLLWKFYY